nr:hypothetical protein [Tanacetum cinerariifolium]
MIDQEMQRNSTNSDGSHSSGGGPTRKLKVLSACPVDSRRWNWTLGREAAYAMTWETLKKKMTEKYCPKGNIMKLEIKLWNLKVKGNDAVSYTQRFQELALMCTKFVVNEKENVDKYIGELPNNIHGNIMSARPKTLDVAIELANDLMDQKLRTYAKRQTESKKNFDNNNQDQQLPKRIQAARDQQKSYADLKRKPMDFQVGDRVMLKLAPWKGVLHFVEEPVEIMDREIKPLNRSRIPIIKVRWNSKRGFKFTWEREDQFKNTYPHLFTKTVSSSNN